MNRGKAPAGARSGTEPVRTEPAMSPPTLTHHEAGGRLELTGHQVGRVGERDRHRAVGRAVGVVDRLRHRLAAEIDHAFGAAVELQRGLEARVAGRLRAQRLGASLQVSSGCSARAGVRGAFGDGAC